jgi:hypothetical protein
MPHWQTFFAKIIAYSQVLQECPVLECVRLHNLLGQQSLGSIGAFTQLPTVGDKLEQEMSTIATNHTSAIISNNPQGSHCLNPFNMQSSLNFGCNSSYNVSQQALFNVMMSNSARGDMQQILQARAGVYGNSLAPELFRPGVDIGSHVKSIAERNKARAMLAGAPLMVAQLGAQDLKRKMVTGKTDILRSLRLGAPSTVGQVLMQLRDAPPLAILKLCNKEAGTFIANTMVQHLQDLNYVQDVLTCVGSHAELKPSILAIHEGFNRRRSLGRFQQGHHSIDFDRLRFAPLATAADNDDFFLNTSRPNAFNSTTQLHENCRGFQTKRGCQNPLRCKLSHKCSVCGKKNHGASTCTQNRGRSKSNRKRRDHRS